MNQTYTISTLQASPSMSRDTETIEVDGYDWADIYTKAVAMAQESWRKTGRATDLYSGKHTVPGSRLYSIKASGEATDYNTIGGKPITAAI